MRQIINKKQKPKTLACYYQGRPIMFDKKNGYCFSDEPSMDDCVNHFLSIEGFELVTKEKKQNLAPKKEESTEKPESKSLFTKKDKEMSPKKESKSKEE